MPHTAGSVLSSGRKLYTFVSSPFLLSPRAFLTAKSTGRRAASYVMFLVLEGPRMFPTWLRAGSATVGGPFSCKKPDENQSLTVRVNVQSVSHICLVSMLGCFILRSIVFMIERWLGPLYDNYEIRCAAFTQLSGVYGGLSGPGLCCFCRA